MTEEEVILNPLFRCAGCGDLLSLHPDLHRHYGPVMLYGEIYHGRCLPHLGTDQGHADLFWALALCNAGMTGSRTYVPAASVGLVGRTTMGGILEKAF